MLKKGALCGLGQTAANPVLTTIRYFRKEYEAHIKQKRCPGGVCKELVTYSIDPELCKGCGKCINVCINNAISGQKKQAHSIDQELCLKCAACYDVCPFALFVSFVTVVVQIPREYKYHLRLFFP